MKNLNILLWAVFGASNKAYWGPGNLGYRMYKTIKDKSVGVYLAHGNGTVDMSDEIFDDTYFIGPYDNAGPAKRFLYPIRGKKWLDRHFAKFEVFHGLGAHEDTFTPAWHFCQKGKPAFLTLMGDKAAFLENSKASLLLGQPQRRIKRANDITGYIANSNAIADMLRRIGVREEKIFRIPNSADTAVFYPVNENERQAKRSQLGIKERLTVIFVGGLTSRKRPLELVQACASIIRKGIEINLVLLGPERIEVGYKKTIEDYVTEQQLQDYIYLIDFSSTPADYYQCADIYVLASKMEGMPSALLEAMACGLPCIVTPVSGSEDLIKDGYNGLYTNGEVEDTAAHILTMIQQETFRKETGRRCLELIHERYSSHSIMQQYLTLFREYSGKKMVTT